MRTLSDTFSVELERSNGATHPRLAGRFDVAATQVMDDAIAADPPAVTSSWTSRRSR